MTGPLMSLRHCRPLPALITITPTDHIASSQPMLWMKRTAKALVLQRISTTGTAVKPKFWKPAVRAKVRMPLPRSKPMTRPTPNAISMPLIIIAKPMTSALATTVPLRSTSLPRILSSMKAGSMITYTTRMIPSSCSRRSTPARLNTAPAASSRYTGSTEANTSQTEITAAAFRPPQFPASA